MATKLTIPDDRMLRLMSWAIQEGIANNEADYFEKIKFPRTNVSNVRRGHQHFTVTHIQNACKLTGASADYIFGFTNIQGRKPAKRAINSLKEIVRAIELELKEK